MLYEIAKEGYLIRGISVRKLQIIMFFKMGIKQTANGKKEPTRVSLKTQEFNFTLPISQPVNAEHWRTMKAAK